MHLQPVIQRELTVISRRRDTWRLRVAYGVGALAAFAFAMLFPHVGPNERGQVALVCLSVSGFVLSLLAGSYLTADCVSSEKREGTLGLLFLTPLNGGQIIMGKMVTHSLQVGYALVGVFPVFFVPLLMGGVLWGEVARIVLVLVLTLLLSLACGVFWSTVSTEARSGILATITTLLLVAFLPMAMPFMARFLAQAPAPATGIPQASPIVALLFAFESNYRAAVPGWGGLSKGSVVYWGSVVVSLIASLGLISLSGWLLPRAWRRAEPGKHAGKSAESGARARNDRAPGGRLLPRWVPKLREAPLLWWASRDLPEPGWLGAVRLGIVIFFAGMLILSVSTKHWREGYISAFCVAYVAHFLTRVQLTVAGTRRLHDERRNGSLEALLATPVTDRDLLAAHHESLRRAFRGPLFTLLALNAGLFLAMLLFPKHLHMDHGAASVFTVFWVGGALVTLADFAVLRWLVLRESLRGATQMKAAGRAFLRLCAVPWLLFGPAFLLAVNNSEEEGAVIFAFWMAGCLAYNAMVAVRCRAWLAPGLRLRVSEAG